MTRRIDRNAGAAILALIVRMLEIFSSIILALMMLLTFVDVVGRYLLGAPIFGATEMISTMLALVIFAGLAIANARDKHIVVELFDSRVRALAPRVYDIAVQGLSLFVMCLIVYVLFDAAFHAAEVGSSTIVLGWSLAWIFGIVAVLAALSVVCQILGLLTGATSPRDHHLEDE
ncbi:TRAP transporter small permease [Halomonas sp. LR5S13]|uniref:TRAP transporter small permease n=1 Tax=Halomonas rhizosphaerae TaxID=3043296 RepID=UPI0024A87989|nr:TRAP transporter small permease [Halomonas rhizosphaerae]MDI5922663.1 TRAP transporter small permease [Halomonas rhizosphaerae]